MEWTILSDYNAEKIENGCCSCLKNFTRFRSVRNALQDLPLHHAPESRSYNVPSNYEPPRSSAQPFSGTGYRLGD